MRHLLIGTLTASAIFAIGGAAYALQATNWRNVPGPITGSYSGGIKGTFRFEATPAGFPSPPSGGACIIFRAKDLGFTEMEKKRCTTHAECGTPGENSTGYCDKQNNKCWSRPTYADADQYLCRRGVTGPTGVSLEISATAAEISNPAWKINHNAKARVLTCLNGLPPGGCGANGNPYYYAWGTPKQL